MRVYRMRQKRVATEPECSVGDATLRRTLQTRRTGNQELKSLVISQIESSSLVVAVVAAMCVS